MHNILSKIFWHYIPKQQQKRFEPNKTIESKFA